MSLEQLALETILDIFANLHDLGDLHALAMTSRYLSIVCLATSSPVLSRLFSNSYDDADLLLLAGVKATQLSDWILGPYDRSEFEQNERMDHIDKELIGCGGPVTEALSCLPMTFQDLVAVWKFENDTVARAVRCMPETWQDEEIDKCSRAEIRLLVLFQEAYYQLFHHTFLVYRTTSREATVPWSSLPAWIVMPSIRRTKDGPSGARSAQEIRQQFTQRFLPISDFHGPNDVPSGRWLLSLFCCRMHDNSHYAPFASNRDDPRLPPAETPLDRWISHRRAFFPDQLLGFNDRSPYGLTFGYLCLLRDLENLRCSDLPVEDDKKDDRLGCINSVCARYNFHAWHGRQGIREVGSELFRSASGCAA
ncbi:hypothetical protein MMC17_006095 [Xylographa soralifera]|nr:hypothetical protein [Xylographa soralifera]